MAKGTHLRCRHCGDPLENRDEAYCPPCNLYRAYRAMPFLLGMLLIGRPGQSAVARTIRLPATTAMPVMTRPRWIWPP